MRILVADDDMTLVFLVSATFKKRGWEVKGALDAPQALMLAKQPPRPDLIILDLSMPGGTGLKTLERLKASTTTAGIPVVVLSGSTDPDMPRAVQEMGAIAFVKKPADPEALAGAIERYFGA